MIDDYEEAIALTEKMKAHLPIKVYATPELRQTMKSQGDRYERDREFFIENVFYAGDEGGITCSLKPDPESKQVYGVSLTHLRIPQDCPLVGQIRAYQNKRKFRLAAGDRKLVKRRWLGKKVIKKKKGFGK